MSSVVRFLFELASLKNVPRSGWLKLGIDEPESVAEHSFLTAAIAFILAYMETKNLDVASKVCAAALFHDAHETRTLDLHKLARRYVKVDEEKARKDVFNFEGGEEIIKLVKEYEDLVKDADKLELLIQAKIYSKNYDSMFYVRDLKFKTKSAKILAEKIREADERWWREVE